MSHILIIDDDTNINNLLREALEKGGYACGQAYSGTEALLRLDMEPFDLVLLDLMLPGMSGEKVLEELFSYYEEWLELGIEPEFSISDEEIQVEAGPQALRRVIQNLIKNGMDHGEKRIRIALERQGDRATGLS